MATEGTVLVIDDEPVVVAALRRYIRRETSYAVVAATDPRAALEELTRTSPDVVITDLAMPGLDGLTVLRRVKDLDPTIEVLVMTAYGSVDVAVEALRAGAFDFLTKPFDSLDHVVSRVRNAMARRRLNARLTDRSDREGGDACDSGIIGKSAVLRELIRTIHDIAGSCINVLIRGESGTGKELIARAIHQSSPRRNRALVAVNCSALVENLLESELFGHARGSFTGATANQRGLFEEAHEGTIFLDEIGELSPQMQAKLLRVLQSGELKRIGENQVRRVDVRVIAATNADLEAAITGGAFREDLYYRLDVLSLRLPSMRERPEDIPLLVEHFLARFAKRQNKRFEGVEPAFVDALMAHDWPGNVRELENIMLRAVVLERSPKLTVGALPQLLRNGDRTRRAVVPLPAHGAGDPTAWLLSLPSRYREARDLALATFHRVYFENLLTRTEGNVSEAARVSGVERSNLKRMLKRSGISASPFREAAASDAPPPPALLSRAARVAMG